MATIRPLQPVVKYGNTGIEARVTFMSVTSFILQTGKLLVLKMRISPLKAVSEIKGQLALLLLSLMIIKIWAVRGTTKTYESQ